MQPGRQRERSPPPDRLANLDAVQVRIRSVFATITLLPWYEADLDFDLVPRTALGFAELRSLITSEREMSQALRRLVVDVGANASGVEWWSDEELVQQLARLIERGLVRVVVEPRPLTCSEPSEESVVPAHVVEPVAPVDEAQHWIEVQLLGEDDEAISGARCQIVMPNGRTIVRTTDRFGLVRVDGVEEAGNCEISFPDLDSEAWEAL